MTTTRERHQNLWHLVTDWRDRAEDTRLISRHGQAAGGQPTLEEIASIYDHCAERLEAELEKLV